MRISPSISIIIPTRNEANYLGQTLEQLIKSITEHNLEIVISDANSTDGTIELIRTYQERVGTDRIKLAQKPGKQNIAIGRNLGASAATADLFFHMDADVRIPEQDAFFTRIKKTFENPSVVAATVPLWIYPEESVLKDRLWHIFTNSVIRISFTLGLYLAKGECQLVRRTAFEQLGGYEEKLVAGEDCNLFYRLGKIGKIAYIHQLCVYHSPRRFRALGYATVSWIYFREALSLIFRRRSYSKEWKPVR